MPFDIQDEWIGCEIVCPICANKFIAQAPQHTPYSIGNTPLQKKKKKRVKYISGTEDTFTHIIKFTIKVLLLVALGFGGFWVYKKITTLTPEKLEGNQLEIMTLKRVNNDGAFGMEANAEKDMFPVVKQKKNFFYRDAFFTKIKLEQVSPDLYEGTVTFVRRSKVITRPVVVDCRSSFTFYSFSCNYANHPEYLIEDSDLIFELAKKMDKSLKEWSFVSATVTVENELVCTIKSGNKEKKLFLIVKQVQCKDKVNRIWIKILK